MKRDLILHLPVIHRGYIDFFKSNKKNIATIHLICNSFFNKLSEFKTDIASLKPEIAKGLLESIGFSDVDIVVSGLKIEKYFKALSAIWTLFPKEIRGIDLIPLEDADEYLRYRVLAEGIILYDKK